MHLIVSLCVRIRRPWGSENEKKTAFICIHYYSDLVSILLHIRKIAAGTFLLPQSKFKEVDHSYILSMNLKLDEILKEVRHPRSEEIDDSLLQKFNQQEKREDDALNDIRSNIRVHTNSLHEIRNDMSSY